MLRFKQVKAQKPDSDLDIFDGHTPNGFVT